MATAPLLAILVVTSSELTSPNRHLLFHYPPHPRPQSADADGYTRQVDDSASDISSSSSSSSSTASSSSSSSRTFSFSGSRVSRIASENTSNITDSNNNRYTIDEDEEHHDTYDQDEVDDERSAYQKRKAPARLTEWTQPLFGLPKTDLAENLIPKDALCDRKFELSLDDVVFLGQPVHLVPPPHDHHSSGPDAATILATSPASSVNDEIDSKETIIRKVRLNKFHIVFVINPGWRMDHHEHVSKMYNEVVKKFTEACKTEESERGYISLEASKIHKIMREAEEKRTPPTLPGVTLILHVLVDFMTDFSGKNYPCRWSGKR
jgi:nitrogen permease regulator 3-like protein